METKNKIFIHADDFGLHKEITDNILSCLDEGCLNSTSIICNTEGFEYGLQYGKKNNKSFMMCLHLNLVEGKPVAPEERVNLIIARNGEFRYSFLSLWLKYFFSNRRLKAEIKEQIHTEILAQVNKFKNAFGRDQPLRIDSHRHFHMIPFIFDIIIEISENVKIAYIRNPYELFYFSLKDLKNYFSSNLIKHILLNYLSLKLMPKLRKKGIQSNKFFIGVLSTGNMTQSSLESALSIIYRRSGFFPGIVEILFHPGGISNKKQITWTTKKTFKDCYSSISRYNESQVIKSDEFKGIINHYENIFNH